MISPDEILHQVNAQLPEALTLAVGRMVEHSIAANRLALDGDAADTLREHCRDTSGRIDEGVPVPYTATAELGDGEFFVIDDDETLAELGEFRVLVDNLGAIPQVTPAELDLTIKLYAVAVGNDSDRILFVRGANPRLTHKAGRVLAVRRERLTRIDGPVFAFSADFHFVLGSRWAVVLDQRSFEILFREIGLVEQRIDKWISGITDHLPMSGVSIDNLREVAMRDSRTWRRLRDIERRGHLAHVTLGQVAEYAVEVGLEPDRVVVNEELVFNPADRFGFLHLLNEDLYKGRLTGVPFESQRKAAME